MGFTKSSKVNEEKMIKNLIKENTDAKKAQEEFIAKIELQKNLIEARKNEHLTQEQLSGRTGLSQQAISRIERGTGWSISSFLKYLSGIGYEVELKKISR